jgi:CheY-like chemotaxis protein
MAGTRCPNVNTSAGDAVRRVDDAAIVIVEDDADVQRAARIALAGSCRLIEVLDTPDGLAGRLAALRFDVVLLDMNFVAGDRSGATGLGALARLQELDASLAVVLMTAYGGVSLAAPRISCSSPGAMTSSSPRCWRLLPPPAADARRRP